MQSEAIPKIIRAGEGACLARRGEIRQQLLDASDTGGALTLARFGLEKGASSSPQSDKDQWFWLENGEFEFHLGAQIHRARASDLVFAPRGVARAYFCQSERGELLIGSLGAASNASDAAPKLTNLSQSECLEAFGDCARVLLASQDTANRFCLLEVETSSLGGSPGHIHEFEDETFLIRAGRYEFQIGDARVQAEPGDVIWAPRGIAHSFRVVSGEPGQFLLLSAPGGFDCFFRRCAALFQSGQATPQALARVAAAHKIEFLPVAS